MSCLYVTGLWSLTAEAAGIRSTEAAEAAMMGSRSGPEVKIEIPF